MHTAAPRQEFYHRSRESAGQSKITQSSTIIIHYLRQLSLGLLAQEAGFAVGHLSDGQLATMLVPTISVLIFFLFYLFVVRPPPPIVYVSERVVESKNCLAKVAGSAKKQMGKPLYRPRWPFWSPL